jgi:hypothetical protein
MSSEEINEINVDQILADAATPESSPEANAEGSLSEKSEPTLENAEVVETTEDAPFTLKYKGKDIGLQDEKFKMYAQKGYDYEQKMHQLRVDRKLWDQQKQKENSQYDELKQINEYTKNNPEFERLIKREWARIQGGGSPTEQLQAQPGQTQHLPPAQQAQLNSILERLDRQDASLRDRQRAEKEASIEGAIESYKEKYSDFDWGTKDELGQTLEDRITQHALDNEIRNFQTAANDMLFDEHVKRAQLQSKEQAAKELQKQHKMGLGKITKESQIQVQGSKGVRSKSYNDLAAEALAELGL